MKKSLLFLMVICLISSIPVNAQGLLKKVTKSMTNELLGKKEDPNQQPEPKCACDKPEVAMNMGGKLELDYKELTISVSDDGRILAKHNGLNEYYIIKDGVTQGPYKENDPRLKDFEAYKEEVPEGTDPWIFKYKEYIAKTGEKYMISFGGKTYGPYGQINNFVVSISKEKFAAIVIENPLMSESDAKKMEEAAKNAKTDQERMDLSMQYAQQMQDKMMQGGGPESMQPKFVSNIPNANYDPIKTVSTFMKGDMKYDDILMIGYNKILDLQGNTIFSIKPEAFGAEKVFVNTDNTKYAYYNYGTLTFSDNTTMSELFSLRMVKVDGKFYLAYMYYSPKKNAIMQCKIPF
jgi:hypothetical protein